MNKNTKVTLSIETIGNFTGDVATCAACGTRCPGIDKFDALRAVLRHIDENH